MFNNSSQFPHQSFEQFKQLKFVFDDASSPKQQSPVKPYEQSLSKPQQKANPPSKQKGKTAAQPAIPSHSFGSGSKGMAPQRAADPFDDSIGPSSATNAYAQSLSSSTGGVRLQDLCPEDKQKIGELIKKLAEEKDEKEKLRKQLETKDDHYKGVIDNLTKENEDIVKNASELQNEFRSSLSLLKSFQESTSKSQSQRQKSKEHKIRQQRQHEEEEDDLQFSQSQPYGQFSQSTSQRRDRKTQSISNNPDDLTMSYLDKGETLRESKERFSPLKDASQRSRQPEFRTQEKPVHKERHIQEAKPPKNKGNVIETLKKEQKAIDEISRLKEDIEGLASSFKKINFSPVESFGAKENEAPRGHQPVFENKHESPIKLIQNYNTGSSEKLQRYDRGYQEHYSPPRQPKSPTQQAYYQESFGKQPSGLKASGYSSSHKQSKQEEKGNSSSDDDEVAIAQKWLNLRKQKIQQINKELNKEKESPKQQRHIQDSQRHDMYYTGSDEKRRRGEEESLYQSRRDEHMQQRKRDQYEEYDQDEERYRMEQEIKRLQMQLKNERRQHQEEQMNRNRPPPLVETQSYRKQQQQYPQQRFEEIEDRDQYGQTWRKNSPPVREVRSSGGFSSATMSGGNKLFSKQASGSASKFQQEALSPTGVVNLNKMSVEDLMNLKNVLDERIRTEKPEALRQHREEYVQSPSRAFIQPQTQQRHDDVFGQRAYMPKENLSPKLNTMETDSHFLEKLRRSGQKTFQTEDHDYERRLAESTIHGRTDHGVDMSLMRDFNSIGNTPANRLMTEGITFPTETPMTQKTEGRDLDYESLYEEKLKEFLKVRERMVKSNKIKDNGLDIEEILKSTLLESKRTNNTVDPHTLMSMHKYTYTNSPATARSFGKPEPPKLSSRDLMLSPPIQAFDKQRHPLQSTQHAHELPEYRVPTFESEPKKQHEFQFMTQPRQIKSPVGKKQMEPIEELGQLADDFYDDGLFDLVDDIEKKGSTSAAQSSSSVLPDSKTTSSRNKNSITNIDDEFKTLFTTVKTMFSPNDDTTTDRIREQLFGRSPKYDKSGFTGYDKSGLTGFNTSKLSYDDEDVENESILNLPAQVLNIGEKGISRKTSGQRSNSSLTQLKTSKNDVSAIESDASMLVINKKINEMKKKKKPMKF